MPTEQPEFFQPGHTYLRPTPHGTTRRFQVLAVGAAPEGFAHPQEGTLVAFGWSQRITQGGNVEPVGSDYQDDFTGWTLDPDTEVVPQLAYRAEYASMELGTYTTMQAARAHCEDDGRHAGPDDVEVELDWYDDESEPLEPSELVMEFGGHSEPTEYTVTPFELLTAYDPEAEN